MGTISDVQEWIRSILYACDYPTRLKDMGIQKRSISCALKKFDVNQETATEIVKEAW